MTRGRRILTGAILALATAVALPGCETAPITKVPMQADHVATTNGESAYRTTDSGTIYIYDRTWDKLVYSGPVGPDQMIKVDPQNSRVLVDNHTVAEQTALGTNDRFEFYLDRRSPVSTTVIEKRTIVENP